MMATNAAPNRELTVRRVCFDHPEVFQGPIEQSDDRRRAFLPTIVRALNLIDGGNWGVLTKTDQGNKVPADFIVWRPTLQGFDVMTDDGAAWIPKGIVDNPRWVWTPVEDGTAPPPPPPPPPLPDLTDVLGLLDAIRDQQLEQEVVLQEIRDALIGAATPAAPVYRGSVLGFAIVLRPDPPAGPKS